MASIVGIPTSDQCQGLESIGERLVAYRGWLHDPHTLTCGFEELVGARGGGSDDDQVDAVHRIARFVDRGIDIDCSRAIAKSVWDTGSSTFRLPARPVIIPTMDSHVSL